MLYFLREVMNLNYIIESHRIHVEDKNGKLIVEATFPLYKDGVVVVDHTYVDPALRGQGIAGELMQKVCEKVEADGMKMVATCPYAVVWFKRHKDYQYLLDDLTQAELSPECRI